MATMKEIAALAGVSRGTVDRVLNHRGTVNAETAKKVNEIAEHLHYEPNRAGIALAAQKKKLKIGVVLFGTSKPFFDQLMEGLSGRLSELSVYGITLVERRTDFDPDEQLAAINSLEEEEISGLILSPYNDWKIRDKVNALAENGIPTVTVNTDIPDSKRIAYVGTDDEKDGRAAAELMSLITGGQAKLGIVTGSNNILSHEARVLSFRDYLSKNTPGIKILGVIENHDDDDLSYDGVMGFLHSHPDIDAFYFTAGGVHGGCRALEDQKPATAPKVVTFDDIPSHREMLEKGIITATICQQPERQGELSLSLLMNTLLTGQAPEHPLHHVELSIKIRESL